MSGSKVPKNEALTIVVEQPEAGRLIDSPPLRLEELREELDGDGFQMAACFARNPMGEHAIVTAQILRGVSHRTAATLLRKIADRLERHGGTLMQMDSGISSVQWLADGRLRHYENSTDEEQVETIIP